MAIQYFDRTRVLHRGPPSAALAHHPHCHIPPLVHRISPPIRGPPRVAADDLHDARAAPLLYRVHRRLRHRRLYCAAHEAPGRRLGECLGAAVDGRQPGGAERPNLVGLEPGAGAQRGLRGVPVRWRRRRLGATEVDRRVP